MATIKSGNSSDQWTIDPLSKAGRVTLYDAAGNPLTSLPVSVANFPVTQPVSGVFFQATQPISAVALPLPSGASTEATLALIKAKTDNLDALLSSRLKPADTLAAITSIGAVASLGTVLDNQAELAASATAAISTGVVLTLPAVVAAFHYITLIEITKYAGAALTGAAAPSVITTTNLPGSLAWSMGTAGAIGTVSDRIIASFAKPLKSLALNTATTITCPLQTGAIYRVNAYYHVGA